MAKGAERAVEMAPTMIKGILILLFLIVLLAAAVQIKIHPCISNGLTSCLQIIFDIAEQGG